jgi:NAD(P)-dependent dehydrogenase (short-subunit alcohol dehydrogenase family)
MTETPFIHDDAFTQEQLEANMKLIPLKRFGKPEEVAYAVIYLLSDASNWVTGSNIVIDGGFTLL